jgi:RNA polymerase sigma factor for flagellar operon FliA
MPKQPCRPRTCHPHQQTDEDQDQNTLVRNIAWQIYSRVPRNASVEIADVLQAGHLGLLRARKSYREECEVPFPVYARYRIRGEILDMLRRLDSAPRSLRRWQRAVENQTRDLSLLLQRIPTDEEISDKLGVEIGKIRRNRQMLVSTTEAHEFPRRCDDDHSKHHRECTAAADSMPDVIQERKESLDALIRSIEVLSPRARRVGLLYYRQNFTMKQIGALLSVNESRISQIHKTALQTMSVVLQSAGIRSAPEFKN